MYRRPLAVTFAIVWICTATTARSADLFDGRTLAGWEGDTEWFRVEDGCIVAGDLSRTIPHNQFLCTRSRQANFELTLQIKLIGPGDNAGVQFRSRRQPGTTEVIGYQADVGSAWDRPVWGGLYDESRRREMLVWPDPDLVAETLRPDDWNRMRIIADGDRIEIYLNGVQTVDYTESDQTIDRTGVIALQIHSGPGTEAWYRNLHLKTLP